MERDNLFVPYGSSEQLQNCYFSPNWDHSLDQNDPFESALSSMVSSPAASNVGAQGSSSSNVVVRELIGRLGSICNSGEVSPQSYIGGNTSTNNSCYSTPLNSPPKLNLSMMENQIRENSGIRPSFAPFPTDPGFAERAARLSCFANKNLSGLNAQSIKISRSSTPENAELGDSRENSSLSEQITGDANPRKRKAIPRGKAKEPSSSNSTKTANATAANDESTAKKSKSGGENGNDSKEKDATKRSDKKDENKDHSKAPEPPKDYIHVRARRGQATDAHSLAERVRREKISERMKLLQDLVPGCNKVTGKAVMLDEIINYVQSLQHQVEFLSMKLSTINPRMDFNAEALLPKEVLQSHNLYQSETSAQGFPFPIQPQHGSDQLPFSSVNHLNTAIGRNHGNHLPHLDTFGESGSQVSSFWEDDLHSVVHMGFGQNQTQNFHGILPTSQMKIEN